MMKRMRWPFRAIQPRKLSTSSLPYNNYTKLRAYPFQVSPEDAQKYLSIFGSTTCNIQKLLPSFGAHYLPFLNFDFVRPVRFSAVYFPAWFVNGEVEANITYKGAQSKEAVWFEDTYIPGSDTDVLSAAPLNCPLLQAGETVPFTESLLHQHGQPVRCIPFSVSPFSVLDVAASSRSIMINKDISIDLPSVKPDLVYAYPALLPLYLAQYEIHDAQDSNNNLFTLIFQAHTPLGAVMCENPSRLSEMSQKTLKMMLKIIGHKFTGEVVSITTLNSRLSVPDTTLRRGIISSSIKEWLEEALSFSSNIKTLAESSLDVIEKGDEDLRIREWRVEECESMEMYTELTAAIMAFKSLLKATRGPQLSALIGGTSKELEAQRAEHAPKWWLEWLALNKPKSKIKSGDENPGTTPPPKDEVAN